MTFLDVYLPMFLQLAGFGQLLLAAASLAIPQVLGWKEKLRPLDPFLRRLFWVYGAYIWGTNIALGISSLVLAHYLARPHPLAVALNLYAAVYWGARIAIQFTVFQKDKPQGKHLWLPELALTLLFLYLTGLYGFLVGQALF
jgi:hypothetical protein